MTHHDRLAAIRVDIGIIAVVHHELRVNHIGDRILPAAAGVAYNLSFVAVLFQKVTQIIHRTAGLREDNRLLLRSKFPHLRPALVQSGQQAFGLGVHGDIVGHLDEMIQLVNLILELLLI